ncbi:hypothetical protein J4464_02990 [Candidatus Woesearchaeota archaeon]|nr:hypothetical protein [Candidatus Woesearchaeota archaeon]
MSNKRFTPEEKHMQEIVKSFQTGLSARDFNTASAALDAIDEQMEPLGYWLPYKDLAKLIRERCTLDEMPLLSPDELLYLTQLSAKLGDMNSDVGLGTNAEAYHRFEDLRGKREGGRITTLATATLPCEVLDDLLLPPDLAEQIPGYKTRRDERHNAREGIWSAWEGAEKLSEGSLENLVASGLTSAKVETYLNTFMTLNLYSNLFQANMDNDMLAHLTGIFKLLYRMKVHEGIPAEQIPHLLSQHIEYYVEEKSHGRLEYDGGEGTRVFMMMHASNQLAEDNFLGLSWQRYDPTQQCMDWILDAGKLEDEEKAFYVSRIARDCTADFQNRAAALVHSTIIDFTRSFVRQGVIDEARGELLMIAQRYFNDDYRKEFIQPFTYKAIVTAAEKGHAFAQSLIQALTPDDDEFSDGLMGIMVDVIARSKAAPFSDHPTETRGSVEYCARNLRDIALAGDYAHTAIEEFMEALDQGQYVAPMNECNTSLEEMRVLSTELATTMLERRGHHTCTDYMYVRDNTAFLYLRDGSQQVIVGNPQHFGTFAALLGYWGNCVSQYDPGKEQPERHVIIEFDNEFLRSRARHNIGNDWFGMPVDTVIPFSLSSEKRCNEKCRWDLTVHNEQSTSQ